MKGKNTVGTPKKRHGYYNFEGIVGINNTLQATVTHLSGSTYWEEPTSAQYYDINNGANNGSVCRLAGNTGSSGTGPDSAYVGISYMYVETSGASTGRNESRVFVKMLGTFDAACRDGIKISYHYMQYGTPTDLIMQWQYLPDGADEVTGWVDIRHHTGNTPQTWTESIFNLKDDFSVTSGRIQLRFYWQMGSDGDYYRHDQAIDELIINEQYFVRGLVHADYQMAFLSTDTTVTSGYLTLNIPSDESLKFDVARETTATYIDATGSRQTVQNHIARMDYSTGFEELLVEPEVYNLYEYSEGSTTQYCTIDDTPYTVSFEGTGTIDFSGAFSGSLSGIGNGYWNRVSLSFTGSVTGSVTSSMSGTVEHKQFERQNFATSFIPTNGSSVQRKFDKVTAANGSGIIDSSKGVLYIEFKPLGHNIHRHLEGGSCSISINDGTSNNFISLRQGFTNTQTSLSAVSRGNDTETFGDTIYITPDPKKTIKMAVSYEQNDVYWYVDGVEEMHDTTYDTHPSGTLDDLSLDQYWGDQFYGRLRTVRYYNDTMTPAQLADLTSIVYKYDVTSMTNNSVSEPLNDTNPQQFKWHPDGNSYWVVGATSDDIVEYSVSEKHNVNSTVTEVASLYIGNEDITMTGMEWNDDGTKLLCCGYNNMRLYEYDCSASYEVNSAAITTTSASFGLRLFALAWNDDGTELTVHLNNDRLRTYEFSTPYTLSTINTTHIKELIQTAEKFSGFNWNDDGSQAVVSDETNNKISSFDATGSYDIGSFSNKKTYDISDVITWGLTDVAIARGIYDKIWIIDGNGDVIREFSIDLE